MRLGAALAFSLAIAAASVDARAQGSAHGAVVVAGSDDATAAAKALAHDVYRDEALRPAIDEATARVLAGEAAAPDANASVKAEADLRASIAKAPSDAEKTKLLAKVAGDVHAEIAAVVVIVDGKPTAKVFRAATSAFEGQPLLGASTPVEGGPPAITWPYATQALRSLLPPPPPPPPPPPLAPEAAPKKTKSSVPIKGPDFAWTSPWFWGTLGVLSAAGVTVFVFAESSASSSPKVHVTGTVPR